MTKSRTDELIIAHTRHELELAHAFDINEEMDGNLGRAVLSVMKLVQHWAGENADMREAVGNAVQILCKGGLLSSITDSPDEWKELTGRPGTWANTRNPFYVSSDAGKTWTNMITKVQGTSEVTDVQKENTRNDQQSSGTANGDATGAATGESKPASERDSGSVAVVEKDARVEKGSQHAGVQSKDDNSDTASEGRETTSPKRKSS